MQNSIKCCVTDCTHNQNSQYCQLSSITVGNNMCQSVRPNTCETTECDSYECKSSSTTNNAAQHTH